MKTIPLEQVTEHKVFYCPICRQETLHEIAKDRDGNRRSAEGYKGTIVFCYDCKCGDTKEVFAEHHSQQGEKDKPSREDYLHKLADTHYESEGFIPEEMTRGREGI